MATWPASIATTPLLESFRPQPPKLIERTEFDAGPAYQRLVATSGQTTFPGLQFRLSTADVATFLEFWMDDIAQGADVFDFTVPTNWPIPDAGTTVIARIMSEHRITPRPGGTSWILEIDLELLPA